MTATYTASQLNWLKISVTWEISFSC